MKTMRKISLLTIFIVSLVSVALTQSGGGYEITRSVISGGPAGQISGGGYESDGVIGQPIAGGILRSAPFEVTSGFFTFTPLAPTAARASISGRVLNQTGTGITNVILYAQTASGEIFMTRSSPFGYYMFEGIEVGQNVFITVEHKRFTFEPRSVMIADNVTDLDFVAQ